MVINWLYANCSTSWYCCCLQPHICVLSHSHSVYLLIYLFIYLFPLAFVLRCPPIFIVLWNHAQNLEEFDRNCKLPFLAKYRTCHKSPPNPIPPALYPEPPPLTPKTFCCEKISRQKCRNFTCWSINDVTRLSLRNNKKTTWKLTGCAFIFLC